MPKRKVAVWRKSGKIFYAKPPDWPKATEYSCTDQETLIEWAHNHGYVLKDGNVRKEIKIHDSPYAANA